MNKNKNLQDFVPSKIAYIILGLFVLGFVAYGIYFSYKKKKDGKKDTLLEVSLVDDSNNELFLDSDGDGAYDWVENLWVELDPFNPDSDGDGVLDGKYIKQKQLIREKERRGVIGVESTLTETEKLGRGVYTALAAIQQSGGEIDEEMQGQISDNVVSYISDLSLGTKLYLREDLNLVSDNKENSFTYRDTMTSFFERYPINTSEIELIIKATENQKEHMLELEKAASKYHLYVAELSQVFVPYIIAGRHTELLNAAGQLEGALKNLTLEEYDDVVALSSVVQIEKTTEAILDSTLHIAKYFEIISEDGIFD